MQGKFTVFVADGMSRVGSALEADYYIGFLGKLSYEVADDAEITKDCYVGEIDYALFMKKAAKT